MCVNHNLQLVFVHIPKTGGVAICDALDLTSVGHFPCSHLRAKYPSYTFFSVIRGEKDRLASAYRYIKNPPVGSANLNSFMTLIKPSTYWIDDHCDYYLRFEHLEKDLNSMLNELGASSVQLKKLNQTNQ